MARYAVVLDACVLVPVTLADTLLRVAEHNLYRPLWTSRIIDEAAGAIAEIHPDISRERIRQRFTAMDDAFEDARIEGYEGLIDGVTLPDPDDRHVVAAALQGRGDSIVTANIRHYPESVLDPLNIDVIHPDSFLLDQLDLAPALILDVLYQQAAHTRRPPLSPVDVVARLARAGAPSFADEVGRMI